MLIAAVAIVSAAAIADEPGAASTVAERPGSFIVIDHPELDESSGLAISRRTDSRFWTHNDSGDRPRLFAIDRPQRRVTVVEISGAAAQDWEDMASMEIDGQPMLVVADVGDNARRRDGVDLYLIAEPESVGEEDALEGDNGPVAVHRTIHVLYPDGPQDCEAIAVDTAQRRVIMVAKGRLPWAGVYAVSLGMDASETREPEEARDATAATQTAQRIGTIPVPMTTALDISADGRQMAVASYLDLFLFEREEDETWEEALRRTPRHVPMPPLKQIEAICYDQQGALWVTSEGDPMPLVRVDVSAGRAE